MTNHWLPNSNLQNLYVVFPLEHRKQVVHNKLGYFSQIRFGKLSIPKVKVYLELIKLSVISMLISMSHVLLCRVIKKSCEISHKQILGSVYIKNCIGSSHTVYWFLLIISDKYFQILSILKTKLPYQGLSNMWFV